MLAFPDCNKPFTLCCDASDVALGYVLSQTDDMNRENVIEYAGRALRKAELNYTVSEKESLAVIEGFGKYHTYLYGNHTTVITDHQALEHVFKNPKITGRIARWSILLQNYDFTVKYKKGKFNANNDAISWLENLPPPDNDNPNDITLRHVDLFTINPDPQDVIDREDSFREHTLNDSIEPDIPSVMPVYDIDIVTAQNNALKLDQFTNSFIEVIFQNTPI